MEMVKRSMGYFSKSNRTTADDFAGSVLDVACEHGSADLWRVDDTLRIYPENDMAMFNGRSIEGLIQKGRAEFLGRYNAHASGLDVLNDIKYFAANYLDGHDAASKYTCLKF